MKTRVWVPQFEIFSATEKGFQFSHSTASEHTTHTHTHTARLPQPVIRYKICNLEREKMEDLKKRKLDEMGNGQLLPNLNESAASLTVEELRALLDPLAKPQLVDLLARA